MKGKSIEGVFQPVTAINVATLLSTKDAQAHKVFFHMLILSL